MIVSGPGTGHQVIKCLYVNERVRDFHYHADDSSTKSFNAILTRHAGVIVYSDRWRDRLQAHSTTQLRVHNHRRTSPLVPPNFCTRPLDPGS
jgi:hypothetical protein